MASWRDVTEPIASKVSAVALCGMGYTFGADSCIALAKLLRTMARIIDDEIVKRERPSRTWRFMGLRITVARDE